MAFDAGAVIGRLEMNLAGWQKSVEAVKKDQQSMTGFAIRHEQQIKSLGKTFTIVGGAMVASLGAMVKKTADYGDAMDELHQRTGASVELLTGLDGALRKNGASTEDLAVGMRFLSGRMVDANNGNKAAIDLFNGLGISITDANGKLRSTTDVLFDVATRFSGMEDGAVKTTAAVDLLGRGGMSLIPTLNLGAEGLKREAEEARRLGKVMTAEAAKGCSDFNDKLVDLKGGLQGVGIQIGTALMPFIQNLVEGVTGIVTKVVEWTKSHEDLTRVLGTTALGVGGIMVALGPMLYMLPGLIRGWQTLVAVLKTSTLALSASVAGITALVAAAAIAYDTVTRLTNAKNAATDADYQAFESNQKLGQKLREVADAAGLTRAEFHQLSLKYDDNNAAMAMAIKRGEEGKAIQEALAKVGKEHADAIDKQKAAQEKANPLIAAANDLLAEADAKTVALADSLDNELKPALDLSGSLNDFSDGVREAFADLDEASDLAANALREEWAAAGEGAAYDMEGALAQIAEGWQSVPEGAKPAIEQTANYFAGLMNDIAIGFGNTIQTWLEGATTFKDFMGGLWGDIKQSFFRMVGEMVAKWVVGFIGNLVKSAVSGAASVAASMGSAITTLGTAAAGIAAGIATVITTLATAIASAATILAAAAPALLIVGGIALALYAGFKLIGGLLEGGGGSGDGMGRVVTRQDQQTALLTTIKDFCLNNIDLAIQWTGKCMDYLWEANGTLRTIANNTAAMANALANVTMATAGAVSTRTELMMVHGTPSRPEYFLQEPQVNNLSMPRESKAAAGQGPVNVTVPLYIDGQKLDERMIRIANGRVEWLDQQYQHSNRLIPTRSIGGA